MPTRLRCLFLLALLLPGVAFAAIEGKVTSSSGDAVPGARVEGAGGEVVFTGEDGRFTLSATEPPATVTVSHPRFGAATADVDGPEPLEIELAPKQEIYEEIVVSASRGQEGFAPLSIAANLVEPSATSIPASTLTELVREVPGVAENGQGGLFQVYSIRGVSRQRVMTLVDGMRIVAERRAGVSASFIDPLLMKSVDVVRGPASSFYGSGALGGVVQLFPREHDGLSVDFGYESQGDLNYQVLGWGGDGWSLGLARRAANDSEQPDGTRLHDGFTQYSATASKSWRRGAYEYSLLGILGLGRDIGKSSTDFPDNRITDYPEENHGLFKFAMAADSGWRLEAWTHPNDLQTDVLRIDESFTTVLNEADDFGASWSTRLREESNAPIVLGVDYFGRRGVDSRETVTPLDDPAGATTLQTLDGAEQDELGLYSAVEWTTGKVKWVGGARAAFQRQQNASAPERDDTALTGFVGAVAPLGGGFELSANAGTGLRFPTLSERFFTGTTGRGGVTGNPDLDSERSVNLDLGVRWYGQRLFLGASVFRNEISDYIERIETEPDVLTFVNLTSGRIIGLELQGSYQLRAGWSLDFGGQALEGRDDADEPLADIPADRVFLRALYGGERWRVEGRWEHRFSKDDPGSGEKEISEAELLSAAISYTLSSGLALTLNGDNLLDEEYFNSADRKVPLSSGRSVGLALSWSGG